MKLLTVQIKLLCLILIITVLFLSLSGCAALSALKGIVGGGTDNNRSTNVEANLAARDNKKAIVSDETDQSYGNHDRITKRGVDIKGGSLAGLIWAGGMGGIDLLLALAILVAARVLCFYFELRNKIRLKKLQVRILENKNKTILPGRK